jgi:WD40 repeat protein
LPWSIQWSNASKDGRFVATVGIRETTKNPPIDLVIRNGATGEIIKTLAAKSGDMILFSPHGEYLAVYSMTSKITLYSTETWQPVGTFQGVKPGISFMAFTPKAGYIVATTADPNNSIWNVKTGEKTYIYPREFSGKLLAISSDSAYIANSSIGINMLKAYWNPTDVKEEIATQTELSIIPNPSISSSVISFSLPTNQNVKVEIFDIQGNLLKTLHSGMLDATTHQFVWATEDVSQGTYFVKLTTPFKTYSQQVQITK